MFYKKNQQNLIINEVACIIVIALANAISGGDALEMIHSDSTESR